MATIIEIAEFFLISLAFGVGAFTSLISTEKTGAGIMRVMSGVCGACSFLALILSLFKSTPNSIQTYSYALVTLCFLLIYFFHQDKKSTGMWLLYGLHCLAGATSIYFGSDTLLSFLYLLISALFLGGITFAMMKGHWYLVTPKLSEKPLLYSVFFIWCLLFFKVCMTGLGFSLGAEYFKEFTLLGEGYLFNWIMFTMRFIWGYLIIFVMSIFAWKLVKMRSIQSATGIFYAMVIFVFIGELISSFLFFKYGLYI